MKVSEPLVVTTRFLAKFCIYILNESSGGLFQAQKIAVCVLIPARSAHCVTGPPLRAPDNCLPSQPIASRDPPSERQKTVFHGGGGGGGARAPDPHPALRAGTSLVWFLLP